MMKDVKVISMDEADRLGYVHEGGLYDVPDLLNAKTMARMLLDTGKDVVVVELRIMREWGGQLIGYAIGQRGR
jgi:hypothetical protein